MASSPRITRYRIGLLTGQGAREVVADLCEEHARSTQQPGAVLLSSDEGAVMGRVISVRMVPGATADCVACSGRIRLQ